LELRVARLVPSLRLGRHHARVGVDQRVVQRSLLRSDGERSDGFALLRAPAPPL